MTKDAAKHLTMHRTATHNKKLSGFKSQKQQGRETVLGKNIGENLCDLGLGQNFSGH